jgi:hypothetical protein
MQVGIWGICCLVQAGVVKRFGADHLLASSSYCRQWLQQQLGGSASDVAAATCGCGCSHCFCCYCGPCNFPCEHGTAVSLLLLLLQLWCMFCVPAPGFWGGFCNPIRPPFGPAFFLFFWGFGMQQLLLVLYCTVRVQGLNVI